MGELFFLDALIFAEQIEKNFLGMPFLSKNEEWHFVIYPYKGLIIPAA